MPALLCLLAISSPSYDELNEGIITHAQAASRMHNAGDTTGAAQQVEQALEMYAAATALAPAEPQAHITAGQFLHNVPRFDEAVEAWERAATTAAALPPQPMGGFASVADFVATRITRSALGKASKARDFAYANGQGNLTAAMAHAAILSFSALASASMTRAVGARVCDDVGDVPRCDGRGRVKSDHPGRPGGRRRRRAGLVCMRVQG